MSRCVCGNCRIVDNNEECKCCAEIPQIRDKNEESIKRNVVEEVPSCIIHHPGFEAVCNVSKIFFELLYSEKYLRQRKTCHLIASRYCNH